MALLSINDSDRPTGDMLTAALARTRPGTPIVIMIHGFRFDPSETCHDPHHHILSQHPNRTCWKAVSWPRRLGLLTDRGLAIGWGWRARGHIWQAHAEASQSGTRLAIAIRELRDHAPDRPIHILAHSLGCRVALRALSVLPAHSVSRLILLSAAVFQSEATAALSTPAGRSAEVINVRGRENTLFDLLMRAAFPLAGPTLGRGLLAPAGRGCRTLDLSLSDEQSLSGLAALGYRVARGRAAICHWSAYLRPGVWRLYRDLVLTPDITPLHLFRIDAADTSAHAQHHAPPAIMGLFPPRSA